MDSVYIVAACLIVWAAMLFESIKLCPICGHEKGPRHRCPA